MGMWNRWNPTSKRWNKFSSECVDMLLYIGLPSLLAVTIYVYLHFMAFSVSEHFPITKLLLSQQLFYGIS